MILHKTHSRMDLIDIINTLDIPIIFSHDDNKKSIHSKFKDLFESENQNHPINIKGVKSLSVVEKEFLVSLLEYTETIWNQSTTSVLDFSKKLGYSKSKLYRMMMSIIGKSPNSFIKEYRLNKALELLDRQVLNISEIAYQTGFSSPTYFSKCFYEAYGILPSKYIKLQLA